jgi:hypothetical protein
MRIFLSQPASKYKPDQYHQSEIELSQITQNRPPSTNTSHSSLFPIILPSIFFVQYIAAELMHPTPRAQSVTT